MVINVQLYRTIKRRLAQGPLPYPLPIEAFPNATEIFPAQSGIPPLAARIAVRYACCHKTPREWPT
jgi:hypothetical protein